MAKCPKCGADMVNDGDNLKCPNCNSTQIKESANAGQAKNGDEQQSELDLLKARLAELEKKQEKVAKQSESSAKIKEKLAPVAVFFKKWGLKAVLPAALFLIAFITLLVCFCGLRGIYVNVNNPNEFYSFSPTSYEYHGNLLGEEYVDEGTWKTSGGELKLTYRDEMFGKITESCPFSHMSYDTIFITDALGDKKEFRRVSVLAYSTPQKTEYTLNLNGGSGSGASENKLSIGSKIKEPSEPTREGFQFMGWYTTADGWKTEGASQFNFNSRIWEDTTIYANWKDLTEYKLTGDMLPEEGVTFLEGDDLTQIYQSAGGVNAKIGNGSAVLEFKDKNGKIVSGAAPRSNVTATLKEVVIGNNVSSIPVKAFEDCTSLTSVIIGDSVTSIGEYAFDGCNSLTSVTIGNGVTSIGDDAFRGCTGLTKINWNAVSVNDFTSSSDVFDNAGKEENGITVTFGDSVQKIPAYAFEYCTSLTSVTIGDGVSSIGKYAFRGCTSLTSVTIPDSVTSIGVYAFYGCTGLTEINWGNNPTIDTIGSYAFSGYKGTSITIPASVTSIGSNAFDGCAAEIDWSSNPTIDTIGSYAFSGYKGTSITIPDSVTSIGDYAFDGCTAEIKWGNNPTIETISSDAFSGYKGTSITIPDSVTRIENYAFSGCIVLETITVDSGNSVYHSAGNCLIETDTKTLIAGCKNSVIPDDGSVTSIGDSAFYYCTLLSSVTIPDSVTSIGRSAFYRCTSLTSVIIGDSVTSIGEYAFDGCNSLTSVTIGNGVTSIGDDAFRGCTGLTEINWNAVSVNDFTSSSDVFDNAGKEENGITVTFGDSVQKIPAYAFEYCTSLTSVTIPDSVTSIGSYAFSGCTSLISITIPDSVTSIGNNAFYGCDSLQRMTLPFVENPLGFLFGASDYIYQNSYIPHSLYIVEITGGNICDYVFYECPSLTSVTIGDGVTSIGDDAFRGCTGLTEINWNAVSVNDFTSSSNVFDNAGKEENGITVTFGDSVQKIPAYAFYNCTSLSSVTIGDSVTSIGDYAFYNCTGLTEINWNAVSVKDFTPNSDVFYNAGKEENGITVTFGDSVQKIPAYAFYNCFSLTSVIIPDSITSIGSYAFYYCTSLKSVTIGDGVTSIGDWAFYYCTSLTSVTIPDSVTSIGRFAFYECTSLTSVTIGNGVTSIGDYAFHGCSSLTSVTIGDGVTSIGDYAFDECTSLTSVTIGNSVESIGYYAFNGCTSLTSVTIGDGVSSIGWHAFNDCTSLTSVTFEGTMMQWRAISKGSNWNNNTPFTKVVCSDGTVGGY